MNKTIRPTLHKNISIGIIFIISAIVFFLSGQLFAMKQPELGEFLNVYFAYSLATCVVLLMILILWEEILFPIKVRPVTGGHIFRNHRTKLQIQVVMYLFIPALIVFLYLTFEINSFRFFIWAGVCLIVPVVGKLISGINNYHDFLTLTDSTIEYKDNEKEGVINLKEIKHIVLLKEEGHLHRLKLELVDTDAVVIELHQMELDAFCEFIEEYINENYKNLLKEG
jgi:hypothetical protein